MAPAVAELKKPSTRSAIGTTSPRPKVIQLTAGAASASASRARERGDEAPPIPAARRNR